MGFTIIQSVLAGQLPWTRVDEIPQMKDVVFIEGLHLTREL